MPIDDENSYDVAYQGVPGAYSEAAARVLVGAAARALPSPTLEQVFEAVADERAHFGVVPLENTIAGTVPGAYELLLASRLEVVAETKTEIDHALIGTADMRMEDVRRVLSHPVALGQCGKFLRRNPQIQPVAVFDTAGAVEIIARERDGFTAAIASRRAASIYGARVLAEHLQDHPDNWTRFGLLARSEPSAWTDGPQRMLVAFDLPHQPGSLMRALEPLARHGINLTKIESRPISTRPFEYRFIVEVTGPDAVGMGGAIEEMRSRTVSLRLLGRFGTATSPGALS